jgi:predicted ribosome quality control (RQC) complex YloA/Tae2 family protein
MALNYEQMKMVLNQIKPLLCNHHFSSCQCINERKFIFKFDNEMQLLISLQTEFLRFHFTNHQWKTAFHPFAETLNKKLFSAKLLTLDLINEDRILKFHFEKASESFYLISELIPKRINLYLINSTNEILLSLFPQQDTHYHLPKKLDVIKTSSPELSIDLLDKHYHALEQAAYFLEQKDNVERQLKLKLKQLNRSKEKFEQEWDRVNKWPEVLHQADLIKANLHLIKKGMTEVNLTDWNTQEDILLKLDPQISPLSIAEKLYKQSKKDKKAIEPLKKLIANSSKDILKFSELLKDLSPIQNEKELILFSQKNHIQKEKHSTRAEKTIPNLPYKEFKTAQGLEVWVGKSAKDNDKLTFSYASGSDYWLHVSGMPGSHVVLHLSKGIQPNEDSIQDAIQAALFFSKAKDIKAGEVSVTLCKHVSRFGKNQPGKVQISNFKTIYAKLDIERLKKLRERK